MPDAAQSFKPIAFFKPGRHTSVDGREIEFTAEQLAEAASVYDAAAHEAPFVIGHPKLNAPAYGWAAGLKYQDGTLYADPKQVNADFAAMVNDGSFKKVSASFYLPDSPGNPKPGKLYLRHIGFLGAAPPSLKGLPDASFAENDGAVTVEFAAPAKRRGLLADVLRRIHAVISSVDLDQLDQADLPSPAFAAPAGADVTTEIDMPENQADFAEREAQLKKQSDDVIARESALKTREEQIAKIETDARRKTLTEFAEGLAKGGQILPRHKAPIVEVLMSFQKDQTVSFAEGAQTVSKAPEEILREFLTSLPKQIDFAEKSADNGQGDGVASFAAPDGALVDQGRLAVHQKALAYQQQHPNTSYVDAIHAVGGR